MEPPGTTSSAYACYAQPDKSSCRHRARIVLVGIPCTHSQNMRKLASLPPQSINVWKVLKQMDDRVYLSGQWTRLKVVRELCDRNGVTRSNKKLHTDDGIWGRGAIC